jgi:hypothetical protein
MTKTEINGEVFNRHAPSFEIDRFDRWQPVPEPPLERLRRRIREPFPEMEV